MTRKRGRSRGAFADDMGRLIAARWAEVFAAIPVAVAGVDPAGVHDVRVASRRLRAAMDVAVDCFSAKWYTPLHRAAREITSELGAVRDRDVLLEAFAADRAAAPPEDWPGIDHLIARITRERDSARVEMLAFLLRLEQSGLQKEVRRRFGDGARDRAGKREPA